MADIQMQEALQQQQQPEAERAPVQVKTSVTVMQEIDACLKDWVASDFKHGFEEDVLFEVPVSVTKDYIDRAVEAEDIAQAKFLKTAKKLRIMLRKLKERHIHKRKMAYRVLASKLREKQFSKSEEDRKQLQLEHAREMRKKTGKEVPRATLQELLSVQGGLPDLS